MGCRTRSELSDALFSARKGGGRKGGGGGLEPREDAWRGMVMEFRKKGTEEMGRAMRKAFCIEPESPSLIQPMTHPSTDDPFFVLVRITAVLLSWKFSNFIFNNREIDGSL